MRFLAIALAIALLIGCQPEPYSTAQNTASQANAEASPKASVQAPAESSAPPDSSPISPPAAIVAQARDVEWLDLMPAHDRTWLESQIDSPITHAGEEADFLSGANNNGYSRRFGVVDALRNQRVRLAGYVVPIELTDAGEIAELLFVPYMGACIHVPAPPPNQIVSAKLHKPQSGVTSWEAYWLEGVLSVQKTESSIASSLYRIEGASLRLWEP
jgi:uncharacterized protein